MLSRRTPLSRKTALKRKTPLRPRSKTKKYATRTRAEDYMRFVRWCACTVGEHEGQRKQCLGPIEADHAGKKTAAFHKSDDMTCIPLCRRHHHQRTGTVNRTGFFKTFTVEQMHAWCTEWIRFHRSLYDNLIKLHQTPWRIT